MDIFNREPSGILNGLNNPQPAASSICGKLLKGMDIDCIDFFNKYYQNIILINKADVKQYQISSTANTHRIYFNLREGATGYLFKAPESASNLSASFSKHDDDGIPLYKHKVQLPIVGVDENAKTLLKQLDLSNCFAAIHFKNGLVEIYGFNYALKTDGYDYEAQSEAGGTSLNLSSKYDEYDPPYIYRPTNVSNWEEQAVTDFNNLFTGIQDVDTGDFNNDFSDDFNIE